MVNPRSLNDLDDYRLSPSISIFKDFRLPGNICNALRNLVLFVQFKKREKLS